MRVHKKLLSLLISLVLIFTSLVSAFAQENILISTRTSVFTDMPNDWSTESLTRAVQNGLLKGSGNKIMPNDYLTKAQLAAIIVRAFGAAKMADISEFTDVNPGAWYFDDIAKAYQMAVIQGTEGKINPDRPVSRQEIYLTVARALRVMPAAVCDIEIDDLDQIADWAKGEVFSLINSGYVEGIEGKVNPTSFMTRAEFAKFFDNVIKKYIRERGTYTFNSFGNVMINAPGVTLKDVLIAGDLIIGDGVGDGDVILENVTIYGRMVVRGGGENSIIIRGNSSAANIVICRIDGKVSIKVEGDADVEVIYIDDGSDDVNIEGSIGSIEIAASGIVVNAIGADIGNAFISGDNARLLVDENSRIDTIEITAENALISGNGSVGTVTAGEGANGASVTTPRTRINVQEGVTGVTGGGGTEIQGGTSENNNQTGSGIEIAQPPQDPVPPVDDQLPQAKLAAKAALNAALAAYTQANYTADNWTALTGYKAAGDTAIDAANDAAGVTSAKNAAIAAMAAVPTLADALSASKTAAKAELAAALAEYVEADYTADNWTVLTGYKAAGDTAINAANDAAGVTSAKNAAIAAMAAVEKISSGELDGDKATARSAVLDGFAAYNERNYPTSFWNDLVGIKDAAIAAIDAAADTAAIDTLKTAALTDMAAIKSWQLYSDQTEPVYNKADKSGVGPVEDSSYMLPKIYRNYITINYDMMATTTAVDANTGFICDEVIPMYRTDHNSHYYAHHSIMVAMNGTFLIINGANWVTGPTFEINKDYHIRIEANMVDHNYEVFITPPGGAEAQVAGGPFSFRTRSAVPGDPANEISPVADNLAMIVVGGGAADQVCIKNLVMTDSATPVDELGAAKIAAKAELAAALAAYVEADYSEFNWAELTGYKTDGDSAIDAALNEAGITAAKNAAISSMESVLTKAEELEAAKTEAKAELASAFAGYIEAFYSTVNWTSLTGFKTAGDTAIDAALDIAGITLAKQTALDGMAGVEKIRVSYSSALDPVYPVVDGTYGPPPEAQYLLPEVYTGNVTIHFDLTANQAAAEIIIGFVDKDIISKFQNYNHMSMIVCLYNNNAIRVRNGGGWVDELAPYVINQAYHFRIEANMIAHTYTVFATVPGEAEVKVGAGDFIFRDAYADVRDADDVAMVVVASQPNGFLENLVITDDTP